MAKHKYLGPFEAVNIPALGLTVAKGDTFDAPDDAVFGEDFEPVTTKKASAPAEAAATTEEN